MILHDRDISAFRSCLIFIGFSGRIRKDQRTVFVDIREEEETMLEQSRILLTLRYLFENTDEEHVVSTRDIKTMLEQHGVQAPVSRTIDADMDLLAAAGFDIVRSHINGQPSYYRFANRPFDTVELKVLIDAVASSRFIKPERSKQVIGHLASLASISDRSCFENEYRQVRTIKKAVGGALAGANDLFRAIIAQKKVRFRLTDYQVRDKAVTAQKGGKAYIVSPYAIIRSDDRYVLVAYEQESSSIITPRVDNIRNVRILEEAIDPSPSEFDIGYYYSGSHKMQDGPEMEVTIECEKSLLGDFIDRFGMDFECRPVSDQSFQATVKACPGNSFFGWLLQYAGRMKLVSPQEAVSLYKAQLAKAIDDL